ncbi:MAG TPA: hypothetical protein VGX46_03445 [Vicinamibacterales bacterium]|jgi:hypothetical protein|nr:hypothetical protein [Vicinamibacterales bacterium]
MRSHRARTFVLTLPLVAALGIKLAAQQRPTTRTGLRQACDIALTNVSRYLDSWTSEQRVQIFFVIMIAVLGILVAALQKPRTELARRSSIGLAIAISILTTINQTLFKIDYHTLARKKQTVRTAGDVIRNDLSLYDDAPEEDRRKLTAEIEQRINTIRDVADEVNPNLIWVFDSLDLTTTANAQPAEPSWLVSPPPDGDSLFAVATGMGATLTEASRKAMDAAARRLAAKAVRQWQRASQSAPVVTVDFEHYVAAKMATVDSHVGRNGKGGEYHYDVLVKIAVALVGEKSYTAFALSSMPGPPPGRDDAPVAEELDEKRPQGDSFVYVYAAPASLFPYKPSIFVDGVRAARLQSGRYFKVKLSSATAANICAETTLRDQRCLEVTVNDGIGYVEIHRTLIAYALRSVSETDMKDDLGKLTAIDVNLVVSKDLVVEPKLGMRANPK